MYFPWKMGIFQPANQLILVYQRVSGMLITYMGKKIRGLLGFAAFGWKRVGISWSLFFFRRNSWRSSNCTWRGPDIGVRNPRNLKGGWVVGEVVGEVVIQKISNRTTESTPKAEYLITRSQLTNRGPLGFGPILFLMDLSYPVSPSGSHNGRQGWFVFSDRKWAVWHPRILKITG